MNAKEELVEPEEVKQQQRDAQKFLCEFIEAYRDQPCLWKYASSDYRNRLVKERAYAGLVEKMREADPCADKDSVMRKINALRTAFRREYKKVRVAGKTGTRASSSSYVPSLWYYDLMKFVVEEQDYTDVPPPGVAIVDWIEDNGEWTPAQQQQQQQQPEAKNTAHADEALMDFIEDTTPSQVAVKVEQVSPVSSRPGSPRLVVAASTTATTTATVTTTTTTTTTTPLAIEIDSVYSEKPPATHSRLEASAEPRTRAPKRLEQPGDLEHFAAYVVSKLKRSSPKQAIIAEKVIAEVLMRANLATLDESTGLTEPSKGPTAPS